MLQTTIPSPTHTRQLPLARALQTAGTVILRYGLVAMLVLFGLAKWTRNEADAIQPWVAHSPFMSWLYAVTTVQGASIAIGIVELIIAAMIAARRFFPRIAAAGSAAAIAMFLTTLSFLFTTPNIDPGSQGFLLKDVFLLGVAVWSTGESMAASARGTA
jgi:reactive chlorine resistance protein C